jgi:hypothetical protein
MLFACKMETGIEKGLLILCWLVVGLTNFTPASDSGKHGEAQDGKEEVLFLELGFLRAMGGSRTGERGFDEAYQPTR